MSTEVLAATTASPGAVAELADGPKIVTLKEVRSNHKVRKLIDGANEVMKSMGYTEHGHRHAGVVSSITK